MILKKTVLILGSSGLIGHHIYLYLEKSKDYELLSISLTRKLKKNSRLLDVRDEELFFKELSKIKPDILINCIGILNKQSIDNSENTIFINSYFPHRLVRFCEETNSKLIHISSDCVFSGKKTKSYTEFNNKDGQDIYSKSKSLGEIIDNKNLTIRTSVVGPEIDNNGKELFNWFMNQKGTTNGYKKVIWSGVTALELAKAVKWAVDYNVKGLYHVTNNKSISKLELLKLFKKYTNKNIEIVPTEDFFLNKSFIDTRKEINYQIPSYDKMINEMVLYIKNNSNLYQHYEL